MSFGVSASEPGAFDYERIFTIADQALYEAKAAGRDRVCVAPGDGSHDLPGRADARRSGIALRALAR